MKDKLSQVCKSFRIEGTCVSYEEITVGNVNRTYKVDFDRGDGILQSYMVQALNAVAFENPVAVMENIDRISAHIHNKCPEYPMLRFCRTEKENSYLFEGDVFWRVYVYVPSVTYNTNTDPDIVRSAGEAFGQFQMLLSDFDPTQLHETIPRFHNTCSRYEKLESVAQADPVGRRSEVEEELAWLLSVREPACTLTRLVETGRLPLRVTHNDTKINNVLFDPTCKQALVVIDLDTVMPGLVGFDFGDAIRFAANFEEEDSPDCSHAGVNIEIFRAFSDGFLKQTANVLTETEIDTLALSCFVLTCEQAVRFLSDYLQGDTYFKIRYPEHNLVRTRCQIALAKDIFEKLPEMQEIINKCIAHYKH